MGITATLFYDSNNTDNQTLHRLITPTEEQLTEQQERWQALAEYLKVALNEETGYAISHWLQGSYKFNTQIRPTSRGDEFDIDLGIYYLLPTELESDGHSPKSLKNLVQEHLKKYKDDNSDDVIEVLEPAKQRCCRVRFHGDFHIDVPCYYLNTKSDLRRLATEKNEWEYSDPKALYIWFRDSFSDNSNSQKSQRIIKYMKCWAGLIFKDPESRPSSVLLTVLVVDAMKSISSHQIGADDDTLLAVVASIIDRLNNNSKVPNPVDRSEDLSSRLSQESFYSFLEELNTLFNIAKTSLKCLTAFEAAIKWQDAFGHFFPLPEKQCIETKSSTALVQSKMLEPDIRIRAVSKINPNIEYTGINYINQIAKEFDVNFEIINPHLLPEGSTVEWVVRNQGDEASYINDLGHKKVERGFSTSRNTAYNGTHYMDCCIKYNGRLIGYRRLHVPICGTPIARRNPVRRPVYTKLRRR